MRRIHQHYKTVIPINYSKVEQSVLLRQVLWFNGMTYEQFLLFLFFSDIYNVISLSVE